MYELLNEVIKNKEKIDDFGIPKMLDENPEIYSNYMEEENEDHEEEVDVWVINNKKVTELGLFNDGFEYNYIYDYDNLLDITTELLLDAGYNSDEIDTYIESTTINDSFYELEYISSDLAILTVDSVFI